MAKFLHTFCSTRRAWACKPILINFHSTNLIFILKFWPKLFRKNGPGQRSAADEHLGPGGRRKSAEGLEIQSGHRKCPETGGKVEAEPLTSTLSFLSSKISRGKKRNKSVGKVSQNLVECDVLLSSAAAYEMEEDEQKMVGQVTRKKIQILKVGVSGVDVMNTIFFDFCQF
jgi:hypothetical protein